LEQLAGLVQQAQEQLQVGQLDAASLATLQATATELRWPELTWDQPSQLLVHQLQCHLQQQQLACRGSLCTTGPKQGGEDSSDLQAALMQCQLSRGRMHQGAVAGQGPLAAAAAATAPTLLGPHLKVTPFNGAHQGPASGGSGVRSSIEAYTAAVAEYRAATAPDSPSALVQLALGTAGLVQMHAHPHQEQSLAKADGWFAQLQQARGRAVAAAHQLVDAGGVDGLPAGATSTAAAAAVAAGGPVGQWGRRSTVRDAWLFIDGRTAAALPWQALAAVTAEGQPHSSQQQPPSHHRSFD
jgi:hypothetical protein